MVHTQGFNLNMVQIKTLCMDLKQVRNMSLLTLVQFWRGSGQIMSRL